jgi:hypothetical protein
VKSNNKLKIMYDYDEAYEREVEYGGQCTLEIATPADMGHERSDWEAMTIEERKESIDEHFEECGDN